MTDRKQIELTDEESLAAERDAMLLNIVRQVNGPNAKSVRELFPNAICISELFSAAMSRETYQVKIALNNGADVNEVGPFGTPLHAAARNGRLNNIRLLVEQGADVSIRDSAGCTAAEVAIQVGHSEIVAYLHSVHKDDETI